MHLLPEILLCVAEEKQPPILGEPSNSSWTSIWQCLPFSPMIQRIQGKPASAVDIPAPMVETSAGVCPELPPPFYLFKTPQFTFLVLLHYSLEGHTQLHCGTFNAWQQDKLLHKTQSPLPHLLNTQAQADTHTHTQPEYTWTEKTQRFFSLFCTRKMGMKGLWKLHPFPQVRINLNFTIPDRCWIGYLFVLSSTTEISKFLEMYSRGKLPLPLRGGGG